jgi:hypothetical protein
MAILQALWTLVKNNPQLIFVVLFIVIPMIGRMVKKTAEMKAKREAKIAAERAEIDAMRTGRGLERGVEQGFELKNQVEAEQLGRDRQRPIDRPARVRRVRLPNGMVVEIPESQDSSEPAPSGRSEVRADKRPAQRPAQPQRKQKQARTPARQQPQTDSSRDSAGVSANKPMRQNVTSTARSSVLSDPEITRAGAMQRAREDAATEDAERHAAGVKLARGSDNTESQQGRSNRGGLVRASIAVPRTPADWRRALVLNEVLGRPISDR